MLAARTALRSSTRSLVSRRHGSSSSHHHEEHGDTDYTVAEGFGTPIWRNVILAGLAAAAFYKYAPEPSESVYLTRWIGMYSHPRDYWLRLNAQHTAVSQSDANQSLLFHDARKPRVHRYRYPQVIGQASPFLNGVGMTVDVSNISVKRDGDISF